MWVQVCLLDCECVYESSVVRINELHFIDWRQHKTLQISTEIDILGKRLHTLVCDSGCADTTNDIKLCVVISFCFECVDQLLHNLRHCECHSTHVDFGFQGEDDNLWFRRMEVRSQVIRTRCLNTCGPYLN